MMVDSVTGQSALKRLNELLDQQGVDLWVHLLRWCRGYVVLVGWFYFSPFFRVIHQLDCEWCCGG